jgi:hypothetical protein
MTVKDGRVTGSFTDAAGNKNTTSTTTITVTDNDKPTYALGLAVRTRHDRTRGVLVSLTASDNIGITVYEINIGGTRNVADVCLEAGVDTLGC